MGRFCASLCGQRAVGREGQQARRDVLAASRALPGPRPQRHRLCGTSFRGYSGSSILETPDDHSRQPRRPHLRTLLDQVDEHADVPGLRHPHQVLEDRLQSRLPGRVQVALQDRRLQLQLPLPPHRLHLDHRCFREPQQAAQPEPP